MKLMAVIKSEVSGQIPDVGVVSRLRPMIIDEFKMVKIEAKRRCKFGEVRWPTGVEVTFVILKDDEELDLEAITKE
jgi:hypothetical protein